MHLQSRASLTGITILFYLAFSILFGISVSAQSECPAGTQPATAGDIATMKAAGIASAQVGQCWDPNSTTIGTSIAEAKKYLLSIAHNLRDSQAPPDEAHIAKLNNTFAVCAANFFHAYTAKYGSVTIVSAYRDLASGENARAGGAPSSNHTRGLAIDVNPTPESSSNNYDTLKNFASSNPSFGVCFPRPPYHGGPDLPHMILAGIGGYEGGSCASQGVTKACSGAPVTPAGPTETPVAQQPPPNNQQAPQQLSSMTTGQTYNQDTICVLSTDPPSSITIPAGTPYPSSCLNGNAPSSVPQGQQAQQQSSTGGTQVASNQSTQPLIAGNISSSQIFPSTNTNSNQKQNTIQTPTLVTNLLTPSSTAAILAALANPQYATTSTTTTIIVMLNPSLATNVSQLQASNIPGVTYAQIPIAPTPATNTSPAYQTTGTGIIPGTHVPSGSDTFASNSLNTSGGQDSFSQSPQVVAGNANSILNSLKVRLVAALSFLSTYTKPFGGNIPSQQEGD